MHKKRFNSDERGNDRYIREAMLHGLSPIEQAMINDYEKEVELKEAVASTAEPTVAPAPALAPAVKSNLQSQLDAAKKALEALLNR